MVAESDGFATVCVELSMRVTMDTAVMVRAVDSNIAECKCIVTSLRALAI